MATKPQIFKVVEKRRKKCCNCDTVIRPGDIIIEYVSSSMGSRSHYSWMHVGCLLNAAPEDCSFEMIMQLMAARPEDKK